ncbi:MAG: type II toxin-antitoxin system Phd/YefM family antitoxin [Methylococcaceae bacterium]|nr:type II toxin-antitoxin system Phd/YefM family antitoxin [Methylococcaceae bacterium]
MTIMMTETATEAKTRFGQILEKSQHEPVVIEKSGRNYAVVISFQEYERMAAIEDAHWAKMAEESRAEGFIGVDESANLIQSLLHAKT